MTFEKFSKSSDSLIKAKQDFFSNNAQHLKRSLEINQVYTQQILRHACMNCLSPVKGQDFESFGVAYKICKQCGHLNGVYEDTDEFATNLYANSDGDNYKANYLSNYDQRVRDIYLPKVEFLIETLGKTVPRVLDIGCGGGHFVRACEIKNVSAKGIDPNKSLAELGQSKISTNTISHCTLADFAKTMIATDANVISLIGVLEHLQRPRDAIKAFKQSKAKYLYISVPLFSFSTFLENAFEGVFPRQLSGGHTHLYSKKSLDYMAQEFSFSIEGEWWFGTDMVDLLRSLIVKSGPGVSEDYQNSLNDYFGHHIDELQNVLDRKKASSEVHMIFSKKDV